MPKEKLSVFEKRKENMYLALFIMYTGVCMVCVYTRIQIHTYTNMLFTFYLFYNYILYFLIFNYAIYSYYVNNMLTYSHYVIHIMLMRTKWNSSLQLSILLLGC